MEEAIQKDSVNEKIVRFEVQSGYTAASYQWNLQVNMSYSLILTACPAHSDLNSCRGVMDLEQLPHVNYESLLRPWPLFIPLLLVPPFHLTRSTSLLTILITKLIDPLLKLTPIFYLLFYIMLPTKPYL